MITAVPTQKLTPKQLVDMFERHPENRARRAMEVSAITALEYAELHEQIKTLILAGKIIYDPVTNKLRRSEVK